MEGDQFWSTVLKKYSDAFEEGIQLKQKLEVLQRQYDEQRMQTNTLQNENEHLAATLRKPAFNLSPTASSSDEQREEALAKLREAEIGLEKARHEYAKLKEKQHASEAKISSLKIQNATLLQEKSQLSRQCESLSGNAVMLQAAVDNAIREKDELKDQLTELMELRLQNAALKSQIVQKQNENLPGPCDDDLKAKIVCQEKEIQELKRSAQTDKSINGEVRAELASARESLQKSKDAHKTLVATFAQLQNMVRNVPVLAQPTTTNVVTSISNAPSSTPAGPSRISFAASTIGASSPAPGLIPYTASNPLDIKLGVLDLSHNDDVTVVEERVSQTCPAYVTPIPKVRRDALAALPPIIPDIGNEYGTPVSFTRNLLASELGGSIQPLIVKVSQSQTKFLRKHRLSCYLCPNLDHNPWCPSTPGQHGYIFVGLGRERDTFAEPEIHNMFVGTKETSQSQRLMTYVGTYRVVRVEPLSKQEWSTLSSDVKCTYCETTKEKTKDLRPRAADLIHSEYDAGQLRVPCLRVQCVGFDKELYTHLIAAKRSPTTVSGSHSPGKRRRDDHDDFGVSTRRRCGRKSH